MKKLLIMLVALSITITAYAQYRETGSAPSIKSRFTNPNLGLFDFFNNPNLDMSHSFSMGYSTSSSGSALQQMYLNSIRYRLSEPLTLNLRLGFSHLPYSSFEGGQSEGSAAFMGSANLQYRPSKNLFLTLGFSNIPYYYYPYGMDGYDWYSNPYRSTSLPFTARPEVFSPGFDDR